MAPAPPHAESLEAAACALQQRHQLIDRKPSSLSLLKALPALPKWFAELQTHCVSAEPEASKAAEWLLDNHYQVERALRQVKKDLPREFFARLPALKRSDQERPPRIYRLAHGLMDATRFQLSMGAAVDFIHAYQEGAPLTTAELWALPTMLRVVCLEILVSASRAVFPGLAAPFEEPASSTAQQTIEPTERIAKALSSLQVIAAISWKDFFDRTSKVEEILRQDPVNVYSSMDFETRDRYRKAVEDIATRAGKPESDVAAQIIAAANSHQGDARLGHVGYWLIDRGDIELKRSLGYRTTLASAIRQFIIKNPGPIYACALVAIGAIALLTPLLYLYSQGASTITLLAGLVVTAMPASILSLTLVNWVFTLYLEPRVLPKLDFEKAIAADCPTAVVMPVILGSEKEAEALIKHLELHWLANPDPALQFVLLSDPTDAVEQISPTDQSVENALVRGVRRLNADHGVDAAGPFHLFHRYRTFNPSEECWMAWERKRGKLDQFNQFILTGESNAFPLIEGRSELLRKTRYVVTVDADTVLPMGSVNRLIGALAHPLNQARIDPASGRLTDGYTIIQPRVEIAPQFEHSSYFLRFFSGDSAIDIYSRAVSDIYQDLFGAAVYVGKGAYDVDAFDRTLRERVPENALLSHDLFEGAHGRVALASDIVFYDGFPTNYLDYARRWCRWVRGDWQLLPWLARRVPSEAGKYLSNCFSVLDFWKIIDNLRRSLIPPALVLLAVIGWLLLPGSPWVWTALTILAPGAYLFTDLAAQLTRGRRQETIQSAFRQFANHAGRWALAIAFLLYEAFAALSAITSTLWRVFVSKRQLLQWTSAAHAAVRFEDENARRVFWLRMWAAPLFSALIAGVLYHYNPNALFPASPLLLIWFLSPEIAYTMSRPIVQTTEKLTDSEREYLRGVARRTWLFFETFVGPEDNWLPPDNFQEDPTAKIAHRTSPTNIGMLLTSGLTAWDFGYLSTTDLVVRVKSLLDTLDKIDRYRGHFLNWYDTRTLIPLDPRYVSTVDSGNLAVCLVTIKEGFEEAARSPALRSAQWSGLQDSFDILANTIERSWNGAHDTDLAAALSTMREAISETGAAQANCRLKLSELIDHLWPSTEQAIAEAISSQNRLAAAKLHEINIWIERVTHDLSNLRWTFENYFPWHDLIADPPSRCIDLASRIQAVLPQDLSLQDAAKKTDEAKALIQEYERQLSRDKGAKTWLGQLDAAIQKGAEQQQDLLRRLLENANRAEQLAHEMDFSLLYDRDYRLFSIGYNVSADRIDPHHYDLLATEARLASYFAIAKGDVPPDHWRVLGRPISRMEGELSLLSWNGSMFEYLMPSLWMRGGRGTLLDQAERTAVSAQRRYAADLGIPWGVSESAFAARDAADHYQYQAFGVPGLGIRRGLARDTVITPYASALALAPFPATAVNNLKELAKLGAMKTFGFIEAIDYTPGRVGGQKHKLVHAYMAHHQGMILTAVGNALNNNKMVARFSSNAHMRSAELLLQERAPWELIPETTPEEEISEAPLERKMAPALHPWTPASEGPTKQTLFLGNGRFASWISHSGSGAIFWHRHALTRWRQDLTRDNDGMWIYVRDKQTKDLWSVGRQPTGVMSQDAHVQFHAHKAEFHRRDHGVAIAMEVGVAAGDDLEIRLLTLTNETDRKRSLELTSCGEVALAPPLDDARHPAFSKLFVESEYIDDFHGLMFTRRPHHPNDQPPVLFHRLILDDLGAKETSFEADRGAFFGRNGKARSPRGVMEGLSKNTGWTLDPIASLQAHIELAPRERRQLAFVTIAGGSQHSALEIAERYATLASLEWALDDAAHEAGILAHRADSRPEWLPQFQQIASLAIDPAPMLRAAPTERKSNQLGQPRLWALGISGDNPIVLLRTSDARGTELLRFLIRAHEHWRRALFRVDLVIMRTGLSGYVEPVRERLLSLFREIGAHDVLGHNGGIHLVFADQIPVADKRLLECAASMVLDDASDAIETVLAGTRKLYAKSPPFEPTAASAPGRGPSPPSAPPAPLVFDNNFGGFTGDSHDYVIRLDAGGATPAPWSNVIANDQFGCLTTEAGLGFTWAVNSGENRLTPWTNDPVCNPPSEALYLRDEETSEFWTVTPSPAGENSACEIRHGAGYTIWRKTSHALDQEMAAFAAPDDPVKFVKLRLQNLESRARRITATYYAEWQLGSIRSTHGMHVVCEYDPTSKALLARNPWNPEFGERVAFVASSRPPHSLTSDRRDFLGRQGDPATPAGLSRWDLGGRIDTAADPCAGFQVHIDIGPGETAELVFILGQGRDRREAEDLIERWRTVESADRALQTSRAQWDKKLSAVNVKTPDPAFDVMINRWLLYQSLSSRILARAGFHQAGGAIGFRDQLQDVLALLHVEPQRARAHILDCARRQFEEGDVLHWWHPPLGRGVRTRCSDDLLWLPYATSEYVEATGDDSILDEEAPFLKAPPLSPEEGDRYALFETSDQSKSLFEHCARALERGVTKGAHGLPLIGAGDWNDGMNRVGAEGRGESVWLGWFAVTTMERFAALAQRRRHASLAERWAKRAAELRMTIDRVAWDGEWYKRAFDDDGMPWGSKDCDECRIDSISQSWAVLAGGDPERAQTAMRSAQRELIDDEYNIARLLWPPVHETPRDPGYLKAYPPGIRENGGQYAHAATWFGLALAKLGDGDGAWRVFDMINPIRRTAAKAGAERYRNEPYVVSADIAGAAPHEGRGGWSWYTGAAAWMWRLGVEAILGVKLSEGKIRLDPCLPKTWGAVTIELTRPEGGLSIQINDPDNLGCGDIELTIDGVPTKETMISFPTDGSTRTVCATIKPSVRDDREPPTPTKKAKRQLTQIK